VAEGKATRRSVLRGGVALAGGGAALAAWPATTSSAPSAKQDAAILRFALIVEDLQAAFYADAIQRGALGGEMLAYAQVVGRHERAHAAHIRKALGANAPAPASFDFGNVNGDPTTFARTAIKLEDLGLAAYNGAAPSLTPTTLADAARIVSVEARHAAWIRDIVGELPAPRAADRPISAAQAKAAIERTGFMR
jgi:ferritin-like protein